MRARNKMRLVSIILCIVMLIGVMPTAAFAAGNTPITTDKVYTYQKIDSVDDIVPGKHFIIVAEYTNETTGETSYHALGARMSFYDGFRLAYRQGNDEYYGVGNTFTISDDKNTITTYYNDTNYEHNYANDYSKNEWEHGILRLRFEAYDLTKNQYKFAVDGHGYMFGFTSRGNDGTAGHHYHAKMPIGTSTSGAPWWQLSVGSNGYWQICTQTTYGSYDGRITGFERIQSYIYPHHGIAATEVSGNSIETFPEANTGILLYMETECNHYIDTLTHIEGKSATCSAPGIKECWYCSDCENYFSDEAMTEAIEPTDIFLPALSHSDTCGHEKEAARFAPCFDTPSGSNESGERYLLIGKAGDKYYAMGNETNADGSRNAVEVVPNENGIITADSDEAEFLTFIWPDSGAIGYFADGGYFSVYEGKVLSYEPSLENANKHIPEPADFRIEDYNTGSGNFGVYSYLSKKSEYIGFDAATLTFKGVSEADESTYLYCELCPHKNMEHIIGIPATCTEQGTIEYWYCEDCYGYYLNGNFEVSVTINNETLFALGHKYNSEGVCENCGMNRHVYRPVTSLAQFDQLSEDASYIIVFKDGSKTYAAYLPGENPYWLDRNFDWEYDLFVVDENENGIPDCIETVDLDENGVLDYMEDQNSDEEIGTYDDYFWVYDALAYAKDEELYAASNFVEVTIADDGSITIVDEGAMEFQLMEAGVWGGQLFDKEMFEYDKEWYGIQETDRMRAMWVPNYWIANGGMLGYYGEDHLMMQERQYGDDAYPGVMDNKNWKINFTGDGTVNFVSSWSDLPDSGALQLVKYGDGKMTMVGLSQDMWEYSDIMQNRTAMLPAYLYASEAVYSEPPHVCDFGDWTDDVNGKTHSRTCKDPECGKTETVSHDWDDGVQIGAPTCTKGAKTVYTCGDCGATYEEDVDNLGHDWGEWTDDGESSPTDTHSRTCKRNCGVAAETENHSWSRWTSVNDNTHKKTCETCDATRTASHNWGEGVVAKEPTEEEEGLMTYTCGDCGHTKGESIDKLEHVHNWSDWAQNNETTHIRSCRCNETETEKHSFDEGVVIQAPSHLAVGEIVYTCSVCGYEKREDMPALEDHEWGSWTANDDGQTHSRSCICNEIETADHTWNEGEVTTQPTHTAEGVKTYTCTACGAKKTEIVDKTPDHEWSDWVDNKDGTHSRSCRCNASETNDCTYDNGVVTEQPTHVEKGIKTYTCTACGHTYDEEIPVLTDHAWGEWVVNKVDEQNTHIRFCVCNESQTAPHNFDDGKVTVEATHTAKGVKTFTCADCGYSYTEEIPETTEHEWTDWSSNGDGTHSRACRCNANETMDCTYDDGVVTTRPTHYEEGVKTFTCTACGHTKTEPVDKTTEHEWGDWAAADNGHIRECKCGATETDVHTWSDWAAQNDGSYVRECADCGCAEIMTLDEDKPVNTTPATNAANTNLNNTGMELIDKILTDEEQSEVADGADVSIYLVVEDISDVVSTVDKAAAEEKAGDDQIGMYLDIDLFKKIDTAETQVTETNGMVTVTITIPDHLINTDESVTRTYKIIRVHDDGTGNLIADVIEGVFNAEDNTFTFQTDKFSTYALAYADEDVNPVTPPDPNKPQTGDTNNMLLWFALLFVSGLGIVGTTVLGRKKYARK